MRWWLWRERWPQLLEIYKQGSYRLLCYCHPRRLIISWFGAIISEAIHLLPVWWYYITHIYIYIYIYIRVGKKLQNWSSHLEHKVCVFWVWFEHINNKIESVNPHWAKRLLVASMYNMYWVSLKKGGFRDHFEVFRGFKSKKFRRLTPI